MWTPRRLGAAIGVAVALATSAAAARAAWTSSQSAGPMTVSTASLAAPTGLSVGVAACARHQSYTLSFDWAASAPADGIAGYTVLASTSSGGPYTAVASVSGASTTAASVTFTDGWSATLHVVVEATGSGWTSGASPEASVATPKQSNCK